MSKFDPAPLLHSRKQNLTQFVEWVQTHIKGDEKGEAQIYLDRLFQAYGQKGVKEAGATFEMRVKKFDAKGTAFADLVWKPYVLIEMKKRGEDLMRHYRQAFDYWVGLVPSRPRYAVLCNFDEFWIYDFENQMDTPIDRVSLAELPARNGALSFLSTTHEQPVFQHDHIKVTRDAADKLAECFRSIVARGVKRADAQSFILQILVALFSEDIGLLEQYTVVRLLEKCKTKEDSYDLIGGLFAAMNDPAGNKGGRYKGVPYFNGGLFKEPARLELQSNEINLLKTAAAFEWTQVRPEIFGTLFEHSLEEGERHAFGQHFTSHADIMKIVGPTIVTPWREAIAGAKTLADMRKLRDRMQHFTVLDPACGSGNFLYIAYRELKRLEKILFDRMATEFPSDAKQGARMSFLSANNFYGLDISPLAVELAKVTMVIARKLSIDELHSNENALPLDNLDHNFKVQDALIDEEGNSTQWPKADVIIGNPPFLGAKRLKPERGADYVNRVRNAYPDVPRMADYCVYWFRKAHEHLPACTIDAPLAGRAGLVGTQNIRNNKSRVGGLDHIVKTGTIIEAVTSQPWSGEANVHVAIANWVKTHDVKLIPASKRLWFRVETLLGTVVRRKRGTGSAMKDYDLEYRECAQINSSLSENTDVGGASVLSCNSEYCYIGQCPRHNGFMIYRDDAEKFIKKDPSNRKVIWPFLVGDELLTRGRSDRFVIDFQRMDLLTAQKYEAPFNRLKSVVLPYIIKKAEVEKKKTKKNTGQDQNWLQTWWQHFRSRPELIGKLRKLKRYIVCSRVTKRPIFVFISSKIRPGDALSCFTFADDYSFGILQSSAHSQWFIAKCSKLGEQFRYTSESIFDTFPWPQKPTKKQIEAVASAGREVRRVRTDALKNLKGGLRALYRTLELPGKNQLKDAHSALDAAVLEAYGFSAKKDMLAQLLALNQHVAAAIEREEIVTAPGVPTSYPDPAALVSEDCIQPDE